MGQFQKLSQNHFIISFIDQILLKLNMKAFVLIALMFLFNGFQGYESKQFQLGFKGVKRCPTGYEAINDIETCKKASKELGLVYSAKDSDGKSKSVCNWCGGCNPMITRVSNNYGSKAKWVCQKGCSGATHQEMTGSGWRDVEITTYSGKTELEKDISCCSKCSKRSDCEYWVRATDSKNCWLKSNDGNAIQGVKSNTRRGGLRFMGC